MCFRNFLDYTRGKLSWNIEYISLVLWSFGKLLHKSLIFSLEESWNCSCCISPDKNVHTLFHFHSNSIFCNNTYYFPESKIQFSAATLVVNFSSLVKSCNMLLVNVTVLFNIKFCNNSEHNAKFCSLQNLINELNTHWKGYCFHFYIQI